MTEPTTAEIEAAARALVLVQSNGCCNTWPRPCDLCDCFRDENPDMRASYEREHMRYALAAALPLVEARLREQIAAEIEASPREGQYAPDWHAAGRRAAKIARGR